MLLRIPTRLNDALGKKGVKLSDIFMNSMLFPYPESEQLNAEHDVLTNMYHNSLLESTNTGARSKSPYCKLADI